MTGITPNPNPLSTPTHSADVLSLLSSITSRQEGFRSHSTFSPSKIRHAPLTGRKIFMHYDTGVPIDRSIENILRRLNAELTDFFSRDLDYIITNRSASRLPPPTPPPPPRQSTSPGDKPLSNTSVSPASQPLSRTPLSSGKSTNPAFTRGRAMLMALSRKEQTSNVSVPSKTSVLGQLQSSNNSTALIRSQQLPGNHGDKPVPYSLPGYPQYTDLLSHARRLGIRIITFESVLKWIKNLPSDVQSFLQSAEDIENSDSGLKDIPSDPEHDRIQQVRYLTVPCIKIFDLKHQYRPLYMDRTDYLPNLWKQLNFHPRFNVAPTPTTFSATTPVATTTNRFDSNAPGGSGSVPAASAGLLTPSQRQLMTPGGTPPVLSLHESRPKCGAAKKQRKPTVKNTPPKLQRSKSMGPRGIGVADRAKTGPKEEPSGYCECCSISFNNLFEHLQCTEHKQFSNNVENYKLLDDVLSKLPSLSEVLQDETIDGDSKPSSVRAKSKTKKRKHVDRQSPTVDDKPMTGQSENRGTSHPSNKSSHVDMDDYIDDHDPSGPPCLKLSNYLSISQAERAATTDKILSFSDVDDDQEECMKQITNVCTTSPTPSLPPLTCLVAAPVSTPLILEPSPSLADECSPKTPNVEVDWHKAFSSVYISDHFRQIVASNMSDEPLDVDASPILEFAHTRCTVCQRSHIPTSIPPDLDLKLHTLVGPGFQLHGIGCDGLRDDFSNTSDIKSNSSGSEISNAHSIVPENIAQHSPTFDGNENSDKVNTSIPTSPMREILADEIQPPPARNIPVLIAPIIGNVPAMSTPFESADQSEQEKSGSPPHDGLLLSPSVHSDITSNRKSTCWLFNDASFDAKLSDLSDNNESPSFINSLNQGILIKMNFSDEEKEENGGTQLQKLPIVHRRKTRLKNLRSKTESSRSRRKTTRNRSPPSAPTPHRPSRSAARVARESISLSVRALFSPSVMDRYGMDLDDADSLRTSHRLSPLRESTSKSATPCTPPPIKSRTQSKLHPKQKSLFFESDLMDNGTMIRSKKSRFNRSISSAMDVDSP